MRSVTTAKAHGKTGDLRWRGRNVSKHTRRQNHHCDGATQRGLRAVLCRASCHDLP